MMLQFTPHGTMLHAALYSLQHVNVYVELFVVSVGEDCRCECVHQGNQHGRQVQPKMRWSYKSHCLKLTVINNMGSFTRVVREGVSK